MHAVTSHHKQFQPFSWTGRNVSTLALCLVLDILRVFLTAVSKIQ